MRPTSPEIIKLNPLLQRRNLEDIEKLLDAIEECGYKWDHSGQMFHSDQLGRGLRTAGLDLFTPDEFRKDHRERVAAIECDPQAYAKYQLGMRLWATHVSKFTWAFVVMLLLGWTVLPVKYWLGALGLIGVSFWIFKKFTFWLITESGYKGPG